MSIAILGIQFSDAKDKVSTIESGSLRYIDSITKNYLNEEDLMSDETYREKIRPYKLHHEGASSKIVLSYIKNNEEKVNLDILYDDEDDIRTRTSSLEEIKSETERARKLLLNSKNQIFLTSFLLNKNLEKTITPTIKMTIGEYKIAKDNGYNVTTRDGEYHISIKDVLNYRLKNKKLGPMRLLVEDTLEVWKRNMLNLDNDELYFYSRELRMLINEYNYRKMPHKVVTNLRFSKSHLRDNLKVNHYNSFRGVSTLGLAKQKTLDDRKVS